VGQPPSGNQEQKSSLGVTYVAVEEAAPRTVLGYFTVAMASVPREAFPAKYARGLPNYGVPLILLARLAVDLRFAGRGIGHALISEAFRISLRVSVEVGCRCVITDSYRDRMSWYARYGFIPIEGAAAEGPQRMFLDIRTIRQASRGVGSPACESAYRPTSSMKRSSNRLIA